MPVWTWLAMLACASKAIARGNLQRRVAHQVVGDDVHIHPDRYRVRAGRHGGQSITATPQEVGTRNAIGSSRIERSTVYAYRSPVHSTTGRTRRVVGIGKPSRYLHNPHALLTKLLLEDVEQRGTGQ